MLINALLILIDADADTDAVIRSVYTWWSVPLSLARSLLTIAKDACTSKILNPSQFCSYFVYWEIYDVLIKQ